MLTRLLLILFFISTGVCQADTFQTENRLYIDADSFEADTDGDQFYIHTGNNVWLVTSAINRDKSGMYAFDHDLKKTKKGPYCECEKNWKCPYCYRYWPIGTPCQNKDCPSKYK